MKKLTKEVAYTTDGMKSVEIINLEFSDSVLESIKKHRLYVAENDDVFKVVLEFDTVELLDYDGDEADFKSDGGELFIFEHSLYFYAQSKYDAKINFESEAIEMSELFAEINQ
jgi:hypothetical protein